MVTKTTRDGRKYDIDGKHIIWHPEQFDDEPALPDFRLPLRVKLGKLLAVGEETTTNAQMFALTRAILGQHSDSADQIYEMDVNDFRAMFATWLNEYNDLTGAQMGESSASSGSSGSTAAP